MTRPRSVRSARDRAVASGLAFAAFAGVTSVLAYRDVADHDESVQAQEALASARADVQAQADELSARDRQLRQYQAELAKAAESLSVQAKRLSQAAPVPAAAPSVAPVLPDVQAPDLTVPVVVQPAPQSDPVPAQQSVSRPDAVSRPS